MNLLKSIQRNGFTRTRRQTRRDKISYNVLSTWLFRWIIRTIKSIKLLIYGLITLIVSVLKSYNRQYKSGKSLSRFCFPNVVKHKLLEKSITYSGLSQSMETDFSQGKDISSKMQFSE